MIINILIFSLIGMAIGFITYDCIMTIKLEKEKKKRVWEK